MKKVNVYKDFDEATHRVLEEGFKRSREERLVWLLNHLKNTSLFSSASKGSPHFQLKKKHG